jgi:hypothetical protein
MNTIEQLTANRDAARLAYENAEHALAVAEEQAKAKTGAQLLDEMMPLTFDGVNYLLDKNGMHQICAPVNVHDKAERAAIIKEVARRLNAYRIWRDKLKEVVRDRMLSDYTTAFVESLLADTGDA